MTAGWVDEREQPDITSLLYMLDSAETNGNTSTWDG